MNERQHTNYGKWSQPSVPHKGWICVDSKDLEEPSQICEMCEHAEIRYVHCMKHTDYSDILEVGCVCAEHMEANKVIPRSRENRLKRNTQRRKTWSKRKWRISNQGNSYLNTDGFNLTIFPATGTNGSTWQLRVVHRSSDTHWYGNSRYQSMDEAKSAALDALIWAKECLDMT